MKSLSFFLFNLCLLLLPTSMFAQETMEVMAAPPIVLSWQGWSVVFILFLALSAIVWGILSPHLAMFVSAATILLIELLLNYYSLGSIAPVSTFVEGFLQPVLLTIAMLCIIARTFEVNGVIKALSEKFLTRSGSWIKEVFCVIALAFPISLVVNNIPVVLILAPIIRRWALKHDRSPSRYLIPLSFAAILGGMCTLIGTSTNLVVNSLLLRAFPHESLSFFEIGWVGLPIGVVGLLIIMILGNFLLPKYADPTLSMSRHTKSFTAEFLIGERCPIVGLTLSHAAKSFFYGATVVEVEREGKFFDNPKGDFKLQENDRLVFVGNINQIGPLHKIDHFRSLNDPHFKVDETSLCFSEIVISSTSKFIGKTLRQVRFRDLYDASVLTIYRQGKRLLGRVGDVILQPGDTLMLLSSGPCQSSDGYHNDYHCIIHNEEVKSTKLQNLFLISAITGLMIFASILFVEHIQWITLATAAIFVALRVVSPKDAVKGIYWNILLLVGSSYSVSFALRETGVLDYLGSLLYISIGQHPTTLIAVTFVLVLFLNEMVTNTAAAILMFPICLKAAFLAGYDSPDTAKALAVTVALAASCSFITPVGYHANMIVYGMGGYKYRDYTKLGLPMALFAFWIAVSLIPKLWTIA